jgi:hypothetical protein
MIRDVFSGYRILDPGSEFFPSPIRISDPGVRKALDTGYRIRSATLENSKTNRC